jgi:hypothetical protein
MARLMCYCPNLQRVFWLCGVVKASIFTAHLSQLTELVFPLAQLLWLSISTAHVFSRLERLAVARVNFASEETVSILLQMPHLKDLATSPPFRLMTAVDAFVEAYAHGIATVVARTTLGRIIWARLSMFDPDRPIEPEEYIAVCTRAQNTLQVVSGRKLKILFECASGRTGISALDGTLWEHGVVDRPRLSP